MLVASGQKHILDLSQLVRDTSLLATFTEFSVAFTQCGVRTWSTPEERALLYGLASRCMQGGVVVELGSYCGGSAAFLAKGLADRRSGGRVVCVDPLLGAPPWLALPPQMFTLAELKANLATLGVATYVDIRIGDSASVGMAWPAEPIDILLIDGDHSFEGALKDLECWAPKLRDHGILLFDDIDNIPEMQELDEIIGRMHTLTRLGAVDGLGVYRVQQGGGWQLLDELRELLADRGIVRPWSVDRVHATTLAPPYRQTREWTRPEFDLAYDLGYLAVATQGDTAILNGTPTELARVVSSIHADRSGGDLHRIHSPVGYGQTCRLVACQPAQATEMARLLRPGGLLLAQAVAPMSADEVAAAANRMRQLGLDGVGHDASATPLFWGVADVGALTPGRVLQALLAVRLVDR
jgi:predicted O-methyltransferase YrrM